MKLQLLAATAALSYAAASLGEVQQAALLANQSLLWNTYRPQLYHGIRPRLPQSLMTGLMWFGLNDYNGNNEIRHTCEQNDALDSYSYTEHDGRFYASQDIVDGKNNMKITTKWLNSEDGKEWSVRIQGEPIDPVKPARLSVIYYFGLEGLGELDYDQSETSGDVHLTGSSPQLRRFKIRLAEHPSVSHLSPVLYADDYAGIGDKTNFVGLQLPSGSVWRIKDGIHRLINAAAKDLMQDYTPETPPDPLALFQLPNKEIGTGSNVWAFQKALGRNAAGEEGKWGFDIYFEQEGSEQMTYPALSQALSAASETYSQRFEASFPLPKPYNTAPYKRFAQAMTSNLLGGIGYYHGSSIVDRSFRHDYDDEDEDEDHGTEEPKLTEERELLTATPSRSFFPRGFYWDEGFHLALIGEWDNDLSLEILKDWIALVDDDGWIAREQILGEESRSKVPSEFQTQYPTYANPPTLAMTVTAFIRRLKAQTQADLLESAMGFDLPRSAPSRLSTLHLENPALAKNFLENIYPSLRRHYLWFRETQRGLLKPYGRRPTSKVEAYRWRGRTEDHVLTSGLDDYPRARPPHSGELHLDLMSWMGFFARTMGEISEYLGEDEDRKEYQKHERGILANLDDLHWSEEEQMYCDVSVDEDEESIHVCHRGYISLFPFLLGLVEPTSDHLKPILDLITDPKHLWSDYGIRSLSRSHSLFGKDENYWRGPIWIQMNWLALKALKERYTVEDGPQRERSVEVYKSLRKNVIENVFREWERTGYVWEQYDAENGQGRRSHPFTGWTALVTMIMSEKY